MSKRDNQDQYDVIQAREEFESMLDPRTAALQERIKQLEEENRILRGNVDEALRMYEVERGLVAELRDYKWMYEELQ